MPAGCVHQCTDAWGGAGGAGVGVSGGVNGASVCGRDWPLMTGLTGLYFACVFLSGYSEKKGVQSRL